MSLTQPSTASVSVGQAVTMSCTVNGGTGTTPWYQQKLGQKPRFLIAGSTRGEGVPDRFSASRSENVGHLTITNAKIEDEADYYCSIWYSSRSMYHSGAV